MIQLQLNDQKIDVNKIEELSMGNNYKLGNYVENFILELCKEARNTQPIELDAFKNLNPVVRIEVL